MSWATLRVLGGERTRMLRMLERQIEIEQAMQAEAAAKAAEEGAIMAQKVSKLTGNH